MRLELGSGDNPTEGYTHLDIRPPADIVDDASTLESIEYGSCDEIRAMHLLEHFGHRDTHHILRLWCLKLKPGGRILIDVPNVEGHILAWQAQRSSTEQFVEYLYGAQDYPENTHMTGFTQESLGRAMRVAGFQTITVVNFGLALRAAATR